VLFNNGRTQIQSNAKTLNLGVVSQSTLKKRSNNLLMFSGFMPIP